MLNEVILNLFQNQDHTYPAPYALLKALNLLGDFSSFVAGVTLLRFRSRF
jgi:hypothetical protein